MLKIKVQSNFILLSYVFFSLIAMSSSCLLKNQGKNNRQSDAKKQTLASKKVVLPSNSIGKIQKKKIAEQTRYGYQIAVDSKMKIALTTKRGNTVLIVDSTGAEIELLNFDTIHEMSIRKIGFDAQDSLVIEYLSEGSDFEVFLKGKNGRFVKYENSRPGSFFFLQNPYPELFFYGGNIPGFHVDSLITDRKEKFSVCYNMYFSPEDSAVFFVWPGCFARMKEARIENVYYVPYADYLGTKLLFFDEQQSLAYYSNGSSLYFVSFCPKLENRKLLEYETDSGVFDFTFSHSTKTIIGIGPGKMEQEFYLDFIRID